MAFQTEQPRTHGRAWKSHEGSAWAVAERTRGAGRLRNKAAEVSKSAGPGPESAGLAESSEQRLGQQSLVGSRRLSPWAGGRMSMRPAWHMDQSASAPGRTPAPQEMPSAARLETVEISQRARGRV